MEEVEDVLNELDRKELSSESFVRDRLFPFWCKVCSLEEGRKKLEISWIDHHQAPAMAGLPFPCGADAPKLLNDRDLSLTLQVRNAGP